MVALRLMRLTVVLILSINHKAVQRDAREDTGASIMTNTDLPALKGVQYGETIGQGAFAMYVLLLLLFGAVVTPGEGLWISTNSELKKPTLKTRPLQSNSQINN